LDKAEPATPGDAKASDDEASAKTDTPSQPPVDEAAGWSVFTSEEGGFAVEFPGEPIHVLEEDEFGVESHIFEAMVDEAEGVYTVMYTDLEDGSGEVDTKAAWAGIIASTEELTTSKKKITLDGHEGMEFQMELEQDGLAVAMRCRVYVLETHLFQVLVARPKVLDEPPQFDRFLNSFRILIEPEPVESEVSGRTHSLTSRSRWPSILERSQTTATRDGLTIGRNYVRTKQGHFLTRNFRFEAVFGIKEGDSIVFVGIGEGRGGGPYKEPANSVHLRIHHESLKSGVGLAKGGQIVGTLRVGPDLPTGVHRAIITKEGDAVTFAIDVDDDGPTDDDMERTVSDIKEFAPYLHSKNTHLFFGGGGAFREVNLTYDPVRAVEPATPPTTPVPPAKTDVSEIPQARSEIALFNGRDLTGWEFMSYRNSKSKNNKTWVAEPQRNVLVSLGGNDHNDLATVGVYGDFELGLEWRFRLGGAVGPNGSGIVVRGGGLNTLKLDPIGIEIDLRPNKDVTRNIGTGCLIAYGTPARNHRGATNGEKNRQLGWIREPQLKSGGEWNQCVITCEGEHLTVEMNGVVVNQASGIQVPRGRIYLRNQQTAVEFRNIRLADLTPSRTSNRMQLNPSSSVEPSPTRSTPASTVVRPASPQRVALTELNTPHTDGYPWVSPNGLTLYWTREGGDVGASSIWTATRRDSDSRFENSRKVLEGRHAVLTGDQLEIVLLAGQAPQKLHYARRRSLGQPFPSPRPMDEFATQPNVKSPFLSPDGRAILFQRRGALPGTTEFALSVRRSPTAGWTAPHAIPMTIDRGRFPDPLTWPSTTSNGLDMLFCHGGGKTPEIVTGSRSRSGDPYGGFRFVQVGAEPLTGRCPRYAEATGELFFCATPSPESDNWDLYAVKGLIVQRHE